MAIIRENEFDRIAAIYERQANECVSAVETFYGEISTLARRTRYAPLVNFSNQIYAFYKGALREHLQQEFERWYDSPYSLHALMRSIAAGNAAEYRAKTYMDRIRGSLEQMFRRGPEQISVDTEEPQIEDSDFAAFSDALTGCSRKLEQASNEALADIRGMASENDAVSCLVSFVKTTGISMTDSFRSMIREVEAGLGLFRNGVQNTLDSVPDAGRGTNAHLPWGAGVPFL